MSRLCLLPTCLPPLPYCPFLVHFILRLHRILQFLECASQAPALGSLCCLLPVIVFPRYLPHSYFLQVLTQLAPSQWVPVQPPFFKLHLSHSTPHLPSSALFFLNSTFHLINYIMSHYLLYFVRLPSLECKLHEDKDLGSPKLTSIFSAPRMLP